MNCNLSDLARTNGTICDSFKCLGCRKLKKDKYDLTVEASRENKIARGNKFFYRKDPNKTNDYAPKFQVGIGNEHKKLIDIHIAKVWQESDAIRMVEMLNAR